jgi:putative two-component system response regulator
MVAPALPVILAVDDAEDLRALIATILGQHARIKLAANALEAVQQALAAPQPDLILLDVEMPGTGGFEVCRALKGNPATAQIPVIFLTGKIGPKDEAHGLELGAVDYVPKPINAAVLRARARTHLALASRQHALEAMVRERTAKLERAYIELVHCLGRAMESHESAAAGFRFKRLAHYAKLVCQAAGAKPAACELMAKAAPLHDIGKLAVPAEILRRRGKLSEPDWERVRRHPELGAEIIGRQEDPALQLARTLALTHHERWDGGGYPKGLRGEAIPWPGRVMAVVDAFEAMTTTQFYRDPLPLAVAEAEIVKGAGTQFDPAVVAAFRKALPELRKVHDAVSDKLADIVNLDFARRARNK